MPFIFASFSNTYRTKTPSTANGNEGVCLQSEPPSTVEGGFTWYGTVSARLRLKVEKHRDDQCNHQYDYQYLGKQGLIPHHYYLLNRALQKIASRKVEIVALLYTSLC
jgi:hypothetical protein